MEELFRGLKTGFCSVDGWWTYFLGRMWAKWESEWEREMEKLVLSLVLSLVFQGWMSLWGNRYGGVRSSG